MITTSVPFGGVVGSGVAAAPSTESAQMVISAAIDAAAPIAGLFMILQPYVNTCRMYMGRPKPSRDRDEAGALAYAFQLP